MNRKKLLEKYYAELDRAILDKLEGRSKIYWINIAKKFGCNNLTVFRRRMAKFPQYNNKKIVDIV